MEEPPKNTERMEECVEDCKYQAIQQFLTDSPWDDRALQERTAQDVNGRIGGSDAMLCLDETAITKKA